MAVDFDSSFTTNTEQRQGRAQPHRLLLLLLLLLLSASPFGSKMENQPPIGRAWFRLGSLARVEPPPLPPVSQPPPIVQPPPQMPRPLLRPQITQPPPLPSVQNRSQEQVRPTGGTSSLPSSPRLSRQVGTLSVPPSPQPPKSAAAGGTSSVPQSPPDRKPTNGTSSVLQSPKLTSAVPQSPPDRKPTTNGTSSVLQSPKLTSSVPQSPPKPTTSGTSAAIPQSPRDPKSMTGGTSSVPQSPKPAPGGANLPKPKPITPAQSPKTIKPEIPPKGFSSSPPSRSPPPSPKTIKPSSHPSPLQLPAAQLKADPEEPESKTAQQKIVEPTRENHPNSPADTKHEPLNHRSPTTQRNHKSWDDQGGMRMITIAGENKGAFMELGNGSAAPSPNKKKHNFHENLHGHILGREEETKKEKASSRVPMNAYVNSNVQSVNNSILLNTSCAHSSPGVHLALSRKPHNRLKNPADS